MHKNPMAEKQNKVDINKGNLIDFEKLTICLHHYLSLFINFYNTTAKA